MSIQLKNIFSVVTYLVLSANSFAEQENVDATGIGISDTKVKACEIALNYARKEAAQAAIAVVSSSFSSIETDSGISQVTDQTITSEAFAKLVEKTEVATFDEQTGQIRCDVNAIFKTGFIKAMSGGEETAHLSSVTQVVTGEFKAGKPFCSKIMDRCFREVYSKQLKDFGIQILPTKQQRKEYLGFSMDERHYNVFFNKIKEYKHSNEYTEVKTQESLMQYIKEKHEKSCETCDVILYINRNEWRRNKGFKDVGFSPYYNTGALSRISIFNTLEVSEKYIKALDEEMSRVQEALDNIN